ncbi:hypothetical protein KL905_001464 [Ogataea polymorpha]|uniref:Mitochondrial thiamine pyrophosphate carrier 1 n=2 Tax=Ogataea polymorpha TaxID=460523 RepID=A0A9P8PEI7_9ASCO|nr:hypothetical protein KL937_002855 [Ogataea polymorpha]KAG7897057.1 hypothetical protein KL908_000459 [Ogataea polymorpha]KAG7903138.1 hypothetical protein KL935_000670 [Ogataea polymorpha]KAG7912257.1 hypothetical protein KL906_000461 [Ogataea polymorpha]KAG7913173.1 hypothetical protein KL907_000118 [Ogataea polymorpha]
MSNSNLRQGVEVPPYISATGGAVSGLVARMVIAPIDVIKIRLQLNGGQDRYRGIIQTVRTILHNEGIRAFWKGNLPAEIMYLIYGATQFATYSTLNQLVSDTEKTLELKVPASIHAVTIGALSGCVSTLMSYPFDVLRTRLAAKENPYFTSFLAEAKEMYAKDGIRAFFRGIQLSMGYVSISMGVSFGVYSFYKDHMANTPLEPAAGLVAGTISKTFVYPLDLVKRRKHMAHEGRFVATMRYILATEGIRGAYHGLTPALIKAAPTAAVSFWCYEWTVDWLMCAKDRFT